MSWLGLRMGFDKSVKLLQSGNWLVVEPTTSHIKTILEPALRYISREFHYGLDKIEHGGRQMTLKESILFTYDFKGRLATTMGMYQRVINALTQASYAPEIIEVTPRKRAHVLEPDWDKLYGGNMKLRPGQEEFLMVFFTQLASRLPGCFDCPTAFGKTALFAFIATLLPEARIDIVTRRVPVLRDRIFPEMSLYVPNVGIVGGGKKKKGCRVQLFTAGSLHHSDGKADLLLCDEVHELAADDSSEKLSRYGDALVYGFSATHNMRLDNKDMRVEAMAGPVVYRMSYQEAVGHGLIVPLEVTWTEVRMPYNPANGYTDPVERKRWGIWRNDYRNALIAADAMSYENEQVLITTETIEHALALKQKLPHYEVVHSVDGLTAGDRSYFMKQGLWPAGGLPHMTLDRMYRLTRDFESAKLKHVIVTTCWNAGVSMNNLGVVCRADAGGSPINDAQIPGRASRTNAAGKLKGIVHDYRDLFDRGFHQKDQSRWRSYASMEWPQKVRSASFESPH